MPVARHCKFWAMDGQGLAVFSTIGNLNRDPAYLWGVGRGEWGVGVKQITSLAPFPIPHSPLPIFFPGDTTIYEFPPEAGSRAGLPGSAYECIRPRPRGATAGRPCAAAHPRARRAVELPGADARQRH